MALYTIRKGQGPGKLSQDEFYYQPYATSHEDLDKDDKMQEEVRVAAKALLRMTLDVRSGKYEKPDRGLSAPRVK